MTVTLYHNPRCSKSRETLALLEAAGLSPVVRLYLKSPPSETEIETLLTQLGFASAQDLMRKGESLYRELNLKNETNESKLRAALSEYPKLIERPIVVNGSRAALGRPPKNALKVIN